MSVLSDLGFDNSRYHAQPHPIQGRIQECLFFFWGGGIVNIIISICERRSQLAQEILLCEQRRTDHRRIPNNNYIFLISPEFSSIAKCNARFIKKKPVVKK